MNYLVKPEASISPMGDCSCDKFSGGVLVNRCHTYIPVCVVDCPMLQICVTPTGSKLSPQGIGTLE